MKEMKDTTKMQITITWIALGVIAIVWALIVCIK